MTAQSCFTLNMAAERFSEMSTEYMMSHSSNYRREKLKSRTVEVSACSVSHLSPLLCSGMSGDMADSSSKDSQPLVEG
jgi:hypothetical protein